MASSKTSQRAYTMRIKGNDLSDEAWKTCLWKTHELVNKGAKAFGDWLLTFRGGLSAELAKITYDEKKKINNRDEVRRRRIFLALSWLSVESKDGAPIEYVVVSGKDEKEERDRKVREEFENILKSQGLVKEEISEWLSDCSQSLSSSIRTDAVWVNRNAAFNNAYQEAKKEGFEITQEDIWDILKPFFVSEKNYFSFEKIEDEDEKEEIDDLKNSKEKKADKAKELVKAAGNWLSKRFGTGKGADFEILVKIYEMISKWQPRETDFVSADECIKSLAKYLTKFKPQGYNIKSILKLISGPGYKSATRNFISKNFNSGKITHEIIKKLKEVALEDIEKCRMKIGKKGVRKYAIYILNKVEQECGLTYLSKKNNTNISILDCYYNTDKSELGTSRHKQYAVILDHAARRISIAHTWMKRAESLREMLERDIKKGNEIPEKVIKILNEYCNAQSLSTGALGDFYISKSAVDGWKDVVKAWSKKDCITEEDRILEVKRLQDELEKFGDVNLFMWLADDKSKCVWHKGGDDTLESETDYLIHYARASEAKQKKQQYKVPAYRHPDAFLHPVFCDYGDSRWGIEYDVHKNRDTKTSKRFVMELFDGEKIKKVHLNWQSKRLMREIVSAAKLDDANASEITRMSRFGTAIAGSENNIYQISGLFKEKFWNGRLQAPRAQLAKVVRIRDSEILNIKEKEEKMRKAIERIKWLITFSPKLVCNGPWYAYIEKSKIIKKKSIPFSDENKSRGSHSKLILCRLPNVRVLSVDLGHRFAASCAVWEAISKSEIKKECKKAGVANPSADDLFVHIPNDNKTTIYRRIGSDILPGGEEHPACWARLDRQFTIKLQGEETETREASNEEIWAVHCFENRFGIRVPLIDRLCRNGFGATEGQKRRLAELIKRGWLKNQIKVEEKTRDEEDGDEELLQRPSLSVGDLMLTTLNNMRIALKRHGDRARIAIAMISDYKILPGGRKYYFLNRKEASENDEDEKRKNNYITHIREHLVIWYKLFSSKKWNDERTKGLWDKYIKPYLINHDSEENQYGIDIEKEVMEKMLTPAAEALVNDLEIRRQISEEFKKQWLEDDEQWKKFLRWFGRWILPRGDAAKKNSSIRKVGGLSLSRIAIITEFRRKVQVGFYTRQHPDGTRETLPEGFASRTLEAIERLREQRIKQLASRIVEAALGLGSENPEHWEEGKKRPRSSIKDPRFAPCHAVIIENLTHYRPDQSRTRRENRQLMNWAAANVKKLLQEQSELHGLYFREVSASYTSRQDSRTGAPGMRCVEISLHNFLKSSWWKKQIKLAEDKIAQGKGDARERYLVKLKEMIQNNTNLNKTVLIPVSGGEIFVSADAKSPIANGINADINAAANIGLRALTDPDWPGKWWYITCDRESRVPDADKIKGCKIFKMNVPLQEREKGGEKVKSNKNLKKAAKVGEKINLWRDISTNSIYEGLEWMDFTPYWNAVQYRVIQNLEKRLNLNK